VARLLKKRGEASDIHIDNLPLKLDSEIQNFAMHGTVGSGKSQLMHKILKQLRDRGDLVIIYDKGCTFVEDFYDGSRDTVLNARDARCPNWTCGRSAALSSRRARSVCVRIRIAATTNFYARCLPFSWISFALSLWVRLPPRWLMANRYFYPKCTHQLRKSDALFSGYRSSGTREIHHPGMDEGSGR